MSEQTFLYPVSNSNRTPSGQAGTGIGSAKAQARVGQIRKRFRRKATDCGAGRDVRDVLAQLFDPIIKLSESGCSQPATQTKSSKNHHPDMWDMLPQVSVGVRRHFLSGAPLIKFFRNAPAALAFDLLRTRLLQTLTAGSTMLTLVV